MKKLAFCIACLAALATAATASAANLTGYGVDMTQTMVDTRWVDGTFEDTDPEATADEAAVSTDGLAAWQRKSWPLNQFEPFYDSAGSNPAHTYVDELMQIKPEAARTGEYGLLIDCEKMIDDARLYRGMDLKTFANPKQKLYIEGYFKIIGNASDAIGTQNEWDAPVHIRIDTYGVYSNGMAAITQNAINAAEDGWIQVSMTTKNDCTGVTNMWVGPAVFEKDSIKQVYLDDLAVYTLPTSMEIEIEKNVYSTFEQISLDDLTLYGVNGDGSKDAFENYDRVNYSIVSGKAKIEDGKIVYDPEGTESTAGTVELQAEFLGVTTTKTFIYGNPITVHTVRKNADNTVETYISNNTADPQKATLLVAVYSEEGVLQKLVQAKNTEIAGNAMYISIKTDALDLEGIENPIIKAYVWNSLTGFVAYTDEQIL